MLVYILREPSMIREVYFKEEEFDKILDYETDIFGFQNHSYESSTICSVDMDEEWLIREAKALFKFQANYINGRFFLTLEVL